MLIQCLCLFGAFGRTNNPRIFFVLIATFSTFLCATTNAAIKVRDDSSNVIQLTTPAKRIVSLAPNLTEILSAIGAGKNIVAISSATNYPEFTRRLPIVANYSSINVEAILSLHPDLVVAWRGGNPNNQLQQIRQLGIPVYQAQFTNIADINRTMLNLAILTGESQQALLIIQQQQREWRALSEQYGNKKLVSVFYQLSDKPLLTISRRSIINQVIELCGGRNVFADTVGVVPQVSIESVVMSNPEVIITTMGGSDWRQMWHAWPQIKAVKKGNLFSLPADLIERPGPRMVLGAKMMCEYLDKARGAKEFAPL